MRCAAFLFIVLFATAPARADDVTFTLPSPLASNAEMMARMFSPFRVVTIARDMKAKGEALGDQPIDLAQEKFTVSVPQAQPEKGYGLVVFIPPWNVPKPPVGWAVTLNAAGLIVVSAGQSGNDQNVVARRMPLALLAEQNIAARYRLDPARIYVSGFSGGSRVAMRLALGYPDIFRGAILDAGSDPIGNAEIPLPPRPLFTRFQTETRLVYLTGEHDTVNHDMDRASLRSMDQWCVMHTTLLSVPSVGHEPAGAIPLARALDALEHPDPVADRADCRARVDRTLNDQLNQAQTLIASSRHDDATKLLNTIDTQYGNLAAPRSLEMAP
jgi:hypothetical protein